MTTYLQAFSLASGERERFDTVLDLQDELGMRPEEIAAVDRQLNRRQRQLIRFYDKVAKLTHAVDAAAERRAAIDSDDRLSARELEVVKCVADGFSDKEIGSLLCISHKTVKSHLVSISGKLRAAGRVDIVIESLRRGLIELPKEKPCLPF